MKTLLLFAVVLLTHANLQAQPIQKADTNTVKETIIPINIWTTETIKLNEINSFQAALKKYDFLNGAIYFFGAGFPVLTVIHSRGEHFQLPDFYMLKCQPGTMIHFDNCKIRLSNSKSIQTIQKLYKII
ncbi:MAG: hypothetical protein ACOYKE_14860 [Ferruginibacter sp.]